jgi:hypothetical protein
MCTSSNPPGEKKVTSFSPPRRYCRHLGPLSFFHSDESSGEEGTHLVYNNSLDLFRLGFVQINLPIKSNDFRSE